MCALRPAPVFCRAACGRVYLWVADPRQVTFLCLSKEKSPKEMTPRSARLLLRARGAPNHGAPVRRRGSPPDFHDYPVSPSPHRALANSPGANYAPRARTRSRLTAPGGAVVLGTRYGDLKTPTEPWFFSNPVWRARASPAWGREPEGRREGSRRSPARTRMSCRATSEARGKRCGSIRAIRAAFSFVAFFWPNKRKPPRVQGRSPLN